MNIKLIIAHKKTWIHYSVLTIVLLILLASYIWTSHRRQYSADFTSDFGEDFLNIVTLGRSMVECMELPTFMFPGKIYDGPVKPFALYLGTQLLANNHIKFRYFEPIGRIGSQQYYIYGRFSFRIMITSLYITGSCSYRLPLLNRKLQP